MKACFYNLAGGIHQASTKTELGMDTRQIYWADAKNVEILQNKGIIRQNGNVLFTQLPSSQKIISMYQMKYGKKYNLLIIAQSGQLYVYNPVTSNLIQLPKEVSGYSDLNFVPFLNGIIVSSENDSPFFIKNNEPFDVIECKLKDSSQMPVKSNVLTVYKGRVWVAEGSSIYFSALGRYDDFTSADDAGYIHNFYTDADDITALKPYKDYLAIYKKSAVYLLTGSNPDDFTIVPFADKGTSSSNSVVNVNNRQYFMHDGIFSLEQGELNQIQVGSEISLKIKPEFDKFDKARLHKAISIHYEKKNQVWYFIPYKEDEFFHTIWINDYVNKAWFKRVIPQDIVTACLFNGDILTADSQGNVFKEDFSNTFNGEAIEFYWKSPFLPIGEANVKKTVDEFYFVLDESFDNNFQFSVFKNYDSEYKDDLDLIYSSNLDNMNWHGDNLAPNQNFYWDDDSKNSLWAINTESVYKAEISESNYALQLCVEGSAPEQNAAIIGLEFKEIFVDE